MDLDLDFENLDNINFEDIKVFTTTDTTDITDNNITDSLIDKLILTLNYITRNKSSIREVKVFNTQTNNNYTTNFILDCTVARYIVTNKDYFDSFNVCNKLVS
jgi:hypothetical protein